jgi:predicted nucleic-acid-binding Zn-ribbon protein
MRTGLCPKCGSGNVFMKKEGVRISDDGLRIPTGMIVQHSPYISYVCTDCGYFENYIVDKPKLAEIAQKWDAVRP